MQIALQDIDQSIEEKKIEYGALKVVNNQRVAKRELLSVRFIQFFFNKQNEIGKLKTKEDECVSEIQSIQTQIDDHHSYIQSI